MTTSGARVEGEDAESGPSSVATWRPSLDRRRLRIGRRVGVALLAVGAGCCLFAGWFGIREYRNDSWLIGRGERTSAHVVSSQGDYRRVEFMYPPGDKHDVTVLSDDYSSVEIAFDPTSPANAVSLSDPYDEVVGWGVLFGVGAALSAAGALIIQGRRAAVTTALTIGDRDRRAPVAKVIRKLSSAATRADVSVSKASRHSLRLVHNDVIVAALLLGQRGVALFDPARCCVGAVDFGERVGQEGRTESWSVIDRTGTHTCVELWLPAPTKSRRRSPSPVTHPRAILLGGRDQSPCGWIERSTAELGDLRGADGLEIIETISASRKPPEIRFIQRSSRSDVASGASQVMAIAINLPKTSHLGRRWRPAWGVAFQLNCPRATRDLILASLAWPRPAARSN